MKFRFILNPRSGAHRSGEDVTRIIHDFIARHALDATLVLTERPHHATELARQSLADGCELIVAIGGDGTLNEIAAALIGTPATLGIIPRGSGNGLVRHLGLPRAPDAALAGLLTGRPRAIDTGLVNGRHPFLNVVGLGFDVEISSRFNRLTRRGLAGYVRTVCGALLSYRKKNYRVTVHPEGTDNSSPVTHELPAFIMAAANSSQYGNEFHIAPGADVDDGLLMLTAIRRVHPLNALPLALRMRCGTLRASRNVLQLTGAHFTVESTDGVPLVCHTDGEVYETTGPRLDITVRPLSLKIMAPAS
ncbi:diacylglycerol kinase family lipid kinase [Opitutaceae bacterium TAV4]|uniref:diacylglycerol/lipid kinase family protein n=1 Tax=Geminisphaera colitermitum TaxID=1148786 RepID=UPI0005BD4E52|nr:diacylglycerol kinase family protein [Geminisphaera colitermitum]RRJ96189.1 diacylglycerol kinase family lipid kinase [Opitutaceae bacterium TAV4]RRK00331.1 diacylglycerol kinase family lipid kinase [Opitutaceae bacterium TAV3]